MCKQHSQGSEARTNCETAAKATFIANVPDYPTKLDKIVKWINLNHTLADATYPTAANTRFYFSDGIKKFDQLCTRMAAVYAAGSGLSVTTTVCDKKVNSEEWTEADKKFQQSMLAGILPNGDRISGASSFGQFNIRHLRFFNSESGHYDHFHVEIK